MTNTRLGVQVSSRGSSAWCLSPPHTTPASPEATLAPKTWTLEPQPGLGLALQPDWPEVSQRAAEHGGNPAAWAAAPMAAVGLHVGGWRMEAGSRSRGLLGGMEEGVQPE